jgi:hypothetical protein
MGTQIIAITVAALAALAGLGWLIRKMGAKTDLASPGRALAAAHAVLEAQAQAIRLSLSGSNPRACSKGFEINGRLKGSYALKPSAGNVEHRLQVTLPGNPSRRETLEIMQVAMFLAEVASLDPDGVALRQAPEGLSVIIDNTCDAMESQRKARSTDAVPSGDIAANIWAQSIQNAAEAWRRIGSAVRGG